MRESTVERHVVSLYFLSQCQKRNFLSNACAYMLDVITNSKTKLGILPHELCYTAVHMAYTIIKLNTNHL